MDLPSLAMVARQAGDARRVAFAAKPVGNGRKPMTSRIGDILRDDRGIAALEYALIAGLIFAAVIAAGAIYGPKLSQAMGNLGQSLTIRDLGT
jgi:Flp pilus assembly pilin Flp